MDHTPDLPTGLTPGPVSGTGRIVVPRAPHAIVAFPLLDSRSACAEALRAYLRCIIFTIDGGLAPNTTFQLLTVNREWPDPNQPLVLSEPGGAKRGVCTVLDPEFGAETQWSTTPCAIEESFEQFQPGSVLWKTSELQVDLQADFWCGNEAERQAIAAAIPTLFAPGEDTYGIYVETPEAYFRRAARLTLIDSPRRGDDVGTIYPRERRLIVRVRAEVDEVHLRTTTLMQTNVQSTVQDGPVPPGGDPSAPDDGAPCAP